ncbi:MAG: sortase [Clostridia bacterium]|nr:sortase [Clostridia bacterium]
MKEYKPIEIKKRKRLDPNVTRMIIFRIIPIALAVVISICSFSIFDKRISEIMAEYKYSQLADRGTIDDPNSDDYSDINIDWLAGYNTTAPDGFDPLSLSPLDSTNGMRPSTVLGSTDFEKALGYTNKQAKLWSIHDSINSDITAWIYMYGLGINYPVAEENGKNDYYLRRSYDKTASTAGTIFMSPECGINPISRNLILHGHNMRDGTMFANLVNFTKGTRKFYDAHRYIFIDTLYGTYRYEIYSVYQCQPEDIYLTVSFASNASFLDWCYKTNDRGLFKNPNTAFSASDRILTLSTCDSTNKYRIVVHARMVYPTPTGDIDSTQNKPVNPDENIIVPNTTPEVNNTPAVTPSPSVTPSVAPEENENIFVEGAQFKIKLSDPKSTLRLRSGPSTTTNILAALAHGTGVKILSENNEWVKIETEGGMVGYLQKKYLVPADNFSFTTPTDQIGPPTTNLITPTPLPTPLPTPAP